MVSDLSSHAAPRRLGFLHWSSWLWIPIMAETLLLIYVWFSYSSPTAPLLLLHLRQWNAYFGPEGLMPVLLHVNLVVAFSLWLSHRSARRLRRELYLPLAATALAGALVVAAISWWVYALQACYPPIQVDQVLELVHDPGAPAAYRPR